MIKFTRKKIIIGLTIVAVIVLIGYFSFGGKKEATYQTMRVERTTVSQEVNVTGRVKAAQAVDLYFERSGRVSQIKMKVGDQVQAGAVLISLDASEIAAELSRTNSAISSAQASEQQNKAAVETQQAKLDQLKLGTRPEELQIVETQLNNAKKALDDAKTSLAATQAKADADIKSLYEGIRDLLNDALLDAEDAVYKQTDDLFMDESSSPKLSYTTSNSQAKIDAENSRSNMNSVLSAFSAIVTSLGTSQSDLDSALISSLAKLRSVSDFLDTVAETLNASTSLSATTSATYKGYVNTARANINTQISAVISRQESISTQKATNAVSISTAQTKVNDAERAVTLAEDQLRLKQAGATAEELRAQEAQLLSAKANLAAAKAAVQQAVASRDNVQAQLNKTVLATPFAGIVTQVDIKIGEIVSPTVSAISLISESLYQIEADIPEADISKVKIGYKAAVTLDAYGDEVVFAASVISIDPAEKLIEGVATYRTVIQFDKNDERIKSGMTANVVIAGEKKENILAVPQRVVVTKGGFKKVKLVEGDNIREVEVETGLRGTDGNIEITKGLNEGDIVVVYSGE